VVETDRSPILKTILLAAAVVVLAAGVAWLWAKVTEADDNSKSEASPTTTPGDPEAEVKADVEAAYRAYLAMETRLTSAPDPDDPEIPERATGRTLDSLRATLADYAAKGQVIRVGPASAQTILSVEVAGSQATVTACYVDESGVFDAATDAAVVPTRIYTSIDRTTLERVDGVWRVSLRTAPQDDELWEGVTTCDR
jgi:hypothetical protein